jgi:hypothetical protein
MSRELQVWGRGGERGSMAMTSSRVAVIPRGDMDAGRLCCEQHGVAPGCTAPRVCSQQPDRVATSHASVGAETGIRDVCRVGANGRALGCLESKYSARVGNGRRSHTHSSPLQSTPVHSSPLHSTRLYPHFNQDADGCAFALDSSSLSSCPSLHLSVSPLWPCLLRLSDLVPCPSFCLSSSFSSSSSSSSSSSFTMSEGP